MSWLSKGTKAVVPSITGATKFALDPFGFGSKPSGQQPGSLNPFAPPDLSFLKDTSGFDYLKSLGSQYKPVDTSRSDSIFNDLLTNIGGQNQNDTEQLSQLLQDIGIDEKNTVGSTKSDFLDRGLGGPGQISDIEANAIAQNRADADRTRAGARTATVGKGLDRLATAYGGKYNAANADATTNANTYNDLLKTGNTTFANIAEDRSKTMAQIMSDLFTGGANNQTKGYIPAQPSYLDSLLRNINLGIKV